jgi:apolipoprotein N-acyltransferase
VAAAVCSSIISPQDYRDFAKNGATLFTNSASLTIFNGSRLFAWEQKSLARFMSVANARYFMQSANAAPAYSLDINGHQTAETDHFNTVDVTAMTNTKKTPYTYLGEWLAWLGALLVGVVLIEKGRKYAKTRKKIVRKK